MYAVGRLSNYISQGVYTVAAPFHPFGGAVDIIVVQQEDGTFKCSPWYVKFGKFQGVLKRREKIVSVAVNGEQADFHMYLDNKGEAFFWKEVESDEEENSIFSPPSAQSSSDEVAMDQQSSGRRVSFKEDDSKDEEKPSGDVLTNSPPSDSIMVCESKEETLSSFYNQTPDSDGKQIESEPPDSNVSKSTSSIAKNGVKNSAVLSKSPSRRKSIFNFVFRRSKRLSESQIMSDTDQSDGQYEGTDIIRRSSLERAEIVANLLDSKWATGDKPNKEETTGEKSMEMNLFSTSSGDSPDKKGTMSNKLMEMDSFSALSGDSTIKEGTLGERSIRVNLFSASSDDCADKEETLDEKSVAINSISNSSANDAQPLEQTMEKTNSGVARSSGSTTNNEETVGVKSMEINSFSNWPGYSVDKEEILDERPVGMNPIYSSSADDAQPLEQTKEMTISNDSCSSFSSTKDSGDSITKYNDSRNPGESTWEDSSQVICNRDIGLTAENDACGNGMLEHSIQHDDSETYHFSSETDIFSMEGTLSEFNKLGQQTSGIDVAQLYQNSDLDIPNPVNPSNVIADVESCLGTFGEFSEQTFAKDVVSQSGNSSCDQEQFSSPQLKTLNSVELSSSSIDVVLTCIKDSQDAITVHISTLDLASEVSHSSCHIQDVSPNLESNVKSEIIINTQQVVDDTHVESTEYGSDKQEQMEHKEHQEEDMQQVITLVKPDNPSSDCNTSMSLSDIQPGSCYLSGSLLESADGSDSYAETGKVTMSLQQVPDAVIEPTIGRGDDEGEQNNCRIKSENLAVICGIPQKELDISLCDCDAARENGTHDQKMVPDKASSVLSCQLYLVGDPDTCTETNDEGQQTLQQILDIAVKPVMEGRNDETEKNVSSAKTDEEATIPVMPPSKELVGSFCDFDTPRENRADENLVSEEAFSCTNPQEDVDVALTCNNISDDKLDDTSRLEFRMQYDLSASLSVSEHYEVHNLDLVFSNNNLVKADKCCVQSKETYSNQMVRSESREDLELTFNDEYVLNGCLALSELKPQTKEGTREHSVPFLTGQVEKMHKQTGNDYQSEELVLSVQLHDEHHTIPSLNANGMDVTDDCNLEHSNGNVSQVSRAEAIPINIPGLHMEGRGDAIQESGSLPNLKNHFLDIEKVDTDRVYSRSLDFNPDCLKQEISCENHFPNFENIESRTFEKETVHGWATTEASTESLKNWNITETATARVQPITGVELSLCRHLLFEGMGSDAASQAFDSFRVSAEQFHNSGPAITKNENLVVKIGGHYFPWDAAAPIILEMVSFGLEGPVQSKGAIHVERVEKALEKYASDSFVSPRGGWKILHSLFRRSKVPQRSFSAQTIPRNDLLGESQVALQDSFDGSLNDYYRKTGKRKMRSNTPTSEQLASLNLKEGQNIITFTFSTRVLGKQQVDARIYLWKWNTRIVVSDVDGTITKSDVLGQFMPLVGKDWTQSGVAHLFSAIKDNGYQLLFLSARAIAQAYLTRQFLLNIKQDGKALPDGPIVISPDGLFPSLYREVIRRAPHEFKIACLEDIRRLFPLDSNPFYAGFGNRDTDEISYLKVGIPKGKIFIINSKGEIAVNHRVDTKSYTSLHTLVNGMFPAMSSSEQEDFNSWNYWKTPLPDIDV
ncbi:hypothetical protein SUGI_1018340 [Cryptomeria japonica]|uniref:phosphatidate phosphatase PAH2 n=1 Tax=Cryptomeria japonica TaxID=3369 RepID=UPI002414B447|nr:phosphatidate phosphatase PAH2 [Cryptomeria japonica]GLJ48230.1 hypothetical protein SUGI_1018340 [Cryptomeria japonica]